MPDQDQAVRAKQAVRELAWTRLQEAGAARFPGVRGRIPNFTGAEAAAELLAAQPEWRAARVVKVNPDLPQLPVRARALADGKRLYMAVPRLADERPFVLLDPAELTAPPRRAASIKGGMRLGRPVAIEEMERVDLVVCGTVAAGRDGVRVGKGGGFSDLEFGLLVEASLIDGGTLLTTTVHPSQVLDGELPETDHDFRVDRIVTPSEVIVTGARRRPPGILWDHLDEEKIAAVPVLARLRRRRV
ncbi:MAG TPA: 5-formyltetrahydrofolate cyclo-ligase [Candidatus Dormibacteraeota bacterium]|jgi:5-formyltetrahydrofolate cyclo-ligase